MYDSKYISDYTNNYNPRNNEALSSPDSNKYSNEILLVSDKNFTKTLYASPELGAILGYSQKDLYNNSFMLLRNLYSDDYKNTKLNVPLRTNMIKRLGNTKGNFFKRHIFSNYLNIKNDEGENFAVIVSFKDFDKPLIINDTQETSSAIKNLQEGVLITDDKNHIKYTNSFLEKILGYDNEDITGKMINEILDENQMDKICDKKCDKNIEGKRIIFVKKNKNRVDTCTKTSPIFDSENKFKGSIFIIKKISENEKNISIKIDKNISDSYTTKCIAHDLNNVLSAIFGYTELALKQTAENSNLYSKITEIKKNSLRASNLVQQLLDQTKQNFSDLMNVNINILVKDLLAMFYQLVGNNIKLTTVFEPNIWTVKANFGQIEQVLTNIVVNARDAIDNNSGEIIIKTKNVSYDNLIRDKFFLNGDYVEMKIVDNGKGMSDEIKSKLFTPFFSTKESGKGSGLGLHICYNIIRQSNGYIFVESEPGRGTTFEIILPRNA